MRTALSMATALPKIRFRDPQVEMAHGAGGIAPENRIVMTVIALPATHERYDGLCLICIALSDLGFRLETARHI